MMLVTMLNCCWSPNHNANIMSCMSLRVNLRKPPFYYHYFICFIIHSIQSLLFCSAISLDVDNDDDDGDDDDNIVAFETWKLFDTFMTCNSIIVLYFTIITIELLIYIFTKLQGGRYQNQVKPMC